MAQVALRVLGGDPEEKNRIRPIDAPPQFAGMCAIVVSRQFPYDSVIGDVWRSIRWTMPETLLQTARDKLVESLVGESPDTWTGR